MRFSKESFLIDQSQKKKIEVLSQDSTKGEIEISLEGKKVQAKYKKTKYGLRLETENKVLDFSFSKTIDEGTLMLSIQQNFSEESWNGLQVMKPFELEMQKSNALQKKGVKIKSQMPGKILKVLVKLDEHVKKGQTLLIMEAMKMENEIKSPADLVVKKIHTEEGKAVESGALLLELE